MTEEEERKEEELWLSAAELPSSEESWRWGWLVEAR
jgi:hypothetical protein